jgi:Cu/Ag efflux pump CusA
VRNILHHHTCMDYLRGILENKGSQEVSRLLWNPRAHYSVDKNLQLVSLKNHVTPLHTLMSCVCNVHFEPIFIFMKNESRPMRPLACPSVCLFDHLAVCVSVSPHKCLFFYAVRVLSKESRRLVQPRIPCFDKKKQ